jgi:peptide chain release factor subunit 1
MITLAELKELVHLDTQGHQVLSLYLNTDLTQHAKGERKLALKKLIEPITADKADLRHVTRFFDREYDWQSLGIAIFSSAPLKLWREIRLAVPVPDYACVDAQPNVRLLSDLLDEYECFAVALVDRNHARFFAIRLGEIEEFAYALPTTPGRHRQGGWSAARYQRRIEAHALQNLKQAAQLTADFFASQKCARLLLAGTKDTLAQFREQLPKTLRARVAGEFAMDLNASSHQVLDKAHQIQERVEREREVAQVEELQTAARKKQLTATLGLADTLNALMEKKVLTLIAASDYRASGAACNHCGYLAAQKLAACPLCGKAMQPVENAVDLAVRRAIELGCRIELVRDPAAAKPGYEHQGGWQPAGPVPPERGLGGEDRHEHGLLQGPIPPRLGA